MGHGKGKSATYYEKPPVPIADYHVTGTLTPDATCNYWYAGIYNGKPYYRRADGAWFIWWGIAPLWYLTEVVGDTTGPAWRRADPEIIGAYVPYEGAIGIATVSAGPH